MVKGVEDTERDRSENGASWMISALSARLALRVDRINTYRLSPEL